VNNINLEIKPISVTAQLSLRFTIAHSLYCRLTVGLVQHYIQHTMSYLVTLI